MLLLETGHLEVVKWLHQNREEGCTGNAMWWAAKGGHLHVLQWLAENRREGMRPNSNSIDWAASNGQCPTAVQRFLPTLFVTFLPLRISRAIVAQQRVCALCALAMSFYNSVEQCVRIAVCSSCCRDTAFR
jgi:hypothetical protein